MSGVSVACELAVPDSVESAVTLRRGAAGPRRRPRERSSWATAAGTHRRICTAAARGSPSSGMADERRPHPSPMSGQARGRAAPKLRLTKCEIASNKIARRSKRDQVGLQTLEQPRSHPRRPLPRKQIKRRHCTENTAQ
jgi:hypothetical protein